MFSVVICACFLVANGCGPKLPYEVVPIAGTITWKGEPVKSDAISITFIPEGEGRPSSASIAPDGKFTAIYSPQADGIQVGKCTMRLTWLADVGGPCPKEWVPMFEKYGTNSPGYSMEIKKADKKMVIALE